MSFVQSIVGFANQILGRAERMVTYYAGLTTLDTQQFTLWADGRPDIAISGTENVTVSSRASCWAHYATQLVHQFPFKKHSPAVSEEHTDEQDIIPPVPVTEGNPRPPCTPDDIEKLHISLVRAYATIPDDSNLLRPDKPDVVGNRFPGVEVLVQWKDGVACDPSLESILPLADSVLSLSQVTAPSGLVGVVPCQAFTDLTQMQDESGHVCTYLTFPNADQSLDDVTAEQARAAVRARPPAPDSLKVDGKRGAEATKEEMRDRDSRKPDEEKKRKEARGSTRRPAEQASPPPSPARVKETQEGTVAKPRTTDARAQDVPPPEKVEVKDRAVPEGSGEAAKPQGKPEDEAPAQGREASEAAGAGAGAGADHGERERQERVERLRTSMEKIEAKLHKGAPPAREEPVSVRAGSPDKPDAPQAPGRLDADDPHKAEVVRMRGSGLKLFKTPQVVQDREDAGKAGAHGWGVGVERSPDQADYVAADLPPGTEARQDSRSGSGWGVGVHALEMPNPGPRYAGPTVVDRVWERFGSWLRKVEGWESAAVRVSLARDAAGDGDDWLATYEEVARTNGAEDVHTAWDKVLRVREAGGDSIVYAGRGPQRQGGAGYPRAETVPAKVTRRLEGAGMHQDVVTTIQWKDARSARALGRCTVCVAEALTNSLYVDPDELTGKLDPSLSAYLMPRNVDTEAAAPRGTHYALRLCTNYTELSGQPITVQYPVHVRYHSPSADGSQSHATAYISNPLIGLSCGDPQTWRWVDYKWDAQSTLAMQMPVGYGYAEGLMWGATGLVVVAGLVYTARAALARKAKTD